MQWNLINDENYTILLRNCFQDLHSCFNSFLGVNRLLQKFFSMIFVILNLILQVSDCSKFSVVTTFKYIDRISPLSHPSVFIIWSFIKTLQKLSINLIVRSKLLTDSKYEFCLDHVRWINYSQYIFIYLPVAFSFLSFSHLLLVLLL